MCGCGGEALELDKKLEGGGDAFQEYRKLGRWQTSSCNNVAPVTNLCLGRATTRSHS